MKKREINLDILRIVSMLLIILLHSIDHTGVLEEADKMGGTIDLYVRFTYMLAQICVNCYVLISGYFLVDSEFKPQKLIRLWVEVVFYSFIIKFIFMIAGGIPFSMLSLVSCFAPVFTGRYWFVTIYFGMYLLSPFLNITIRAMNKREHLRLNLLLIILMSGMVSVYPNFKGMNSGAGWGLAWFVVLYFLAAWIKLYHERSTKIFSCYVTWIGISFVIACLYCGLSNKNVLVKSVLENWYRYDSLPVLICSLAVFIGSINLQINLKNTRIITALSSATFGVYLIHAHANVSPWIWGIADLANKMNEQFWSAWQIITIIIIFVFCSCIDIIREKTLGRLKLDNCIYNELIHIFKKFIRNSK